MFHSSKANNSRDNRQPKGEALAKPNDRVAADKVVVSHKLQVNDDMYLSFLGLLRD